MILNSLSVVNYKNIRAANLVFSPKINCFVGNNGEGKTNLLDAIYFLSFCHSSFTTLDSTVMQHDQGFFMLEGFYRSEEGTDEVVTASMKRGHAKQFKRNKKAYKRLAEHIGHIPLIFVSPSDSILVEGGGGERRKLMDVVISQTDHIYMDALMRYDKAVQQRNALLKMESEPDLSLLVLWEEEMARHGTLIFERRTAFLEQFVPIFQDVYAHISGGGEAVSLRYVSHGQRGDLLEVIQRDRQKDRVVGYSLHGTHRDDLEMLLDGYPMRREGSQGQTKTFVLALKLAQFDFLRRTATRTTPLLLLDDIFDKLDSRRVGQIIDLVSGENYGQIFITDTNREHLDKILGRGKHDYKLFDVAGGEIGERL